MRQRFIKREYHLASASLPPIFPVDDPAVTALLKEVPAASYLPHSDRSFLEHLIGTWWILSQWKMPRTICRAGLLHSCYSTEFYPYALFDIRARSKVRLIIGRHAEALAYRFCIIDRSHLWSLVAQKSSLGGGLNVRRIDDRRPLFLPEGTVKSLLLIESANLAEQSVAPDGLPTRWMSRLASWSRLLGRRRGLPIPFHLRPTITPAADRRALEKYRLVMSAPSSAAPLLLDDTIRLNPWAGEPRLLRALCALERFETERAFSEAAQGHALLSSWAVAWDKRLTLITWLNLATAILQRTTGIDQSKDTRLSFKSVRAALVKASSGRNEHLIA